MIKVEKCKCADADNWFNFLFYFCFYYRRRQISRTIESTNKKNDFNEAKEMKELFLKFCKAHAQVKAQKGQAQHEVCLFTSHANDEKQ